VTNYAADIPRTIGKRGKDYCCWNPRLKMYLTK